MMFIFLIHKYPDNVLDIKTIYAQNVHIPHILLTIGAQCQRSTPYPTLSHLIPKASHWMHQVFLLEQYQG